MDLACGHKGPADDRANYLWCDTCRCWVRVEKKERAYAAIDGLLGVVTDHHALHSRP
jgi:hypothetical protein